MPLLATVSFQRCRITSLQYFHPGSISLGIDLCRGLIVGTH